MSKHKKVSGFLAATLLLSGLFNASSKTYAQSRPPRANFEMAVEQVTANPGLEGNGVDMYVVLEASHRTVNTKQDTISNSNNIYPDNWSIAWSMPGTLEDQTEEIRITVYDRDTGRRIKKNRDDLLFSQSYSFDPNECKISWMPETGERIFYEKSGVKDGEICTFELEGGIGNLDYLKFYVSSWQS